MQTCQFSENCPNPATIQSSYYPNGICKKHFIQNIEERAIETIKNHNLIDFINPSEKILVAISGGKDSQTLLTILHIFLKIKSNSKHFILK